MLVAPDGAGSRGRLAAAKCVSVVRSVASCVALLNLSTEDRVLKTAGLGCSSCHAAHCTLHIPIKCAATTRPTRPQPSQMLEGTTSLVKAVCILAASTSPTPAATGVIIGSLGEGIGGILMVIAASQVGCCLQPHREGATMQEMNGQQGKVNSAKGFGDVANRPLPRLAHRLDHGRDGGPSVRQQGGCLQGAERSLTFRAGSNGDIPGQCSVSACEERYGRIGEWGGSWSANHDCVSSKRDSRCSGNTTAYLSSASAFSNLDERVNECYPLLCCLPAGGEPPANFVPLAEHNCPFADGTQDPAYGCQYREFRSRPPSSRRHRLVPPLAPPCSPFRSSRASSTRRRGRRAGILLQPVPVWPSRRCSRSRWRR